jgi:hypothetical protein
VVLAVLAVPAALTASPALAAGATQSALCDGYQAGNCAITPDNGPIMSDGEPRGVTVYGRPGVQVSVQFYVIEFNRAGQITGLVPSGTPATGTTAEVRPGEGVLNGARIVPRTSGSLGGGWGFVGLADDGDIDLRRRLGTVVQFGGRTLRSLGDGFAEQKPVGTPLDLHVIGNVQGVGYWVEYRDANGDWVPVPGHGYGSATHLASTPGEISQLTYTVPGTLTRGREYTFRVNHHLNYGGSPDRPVADPAFLEWTVIPAATGEESGRGNNFDPGLGPGEEDGPDDGGPGDGDPGDGDPGDGPEDPEPTQEPDPTDAPDPTPSPEPTPEDDSGEDDSGEDDSGEGDTGEDDTGRNDPDEAARPADDPDAEQQIDQAVVWGSEDMGTPLPSSAPQPAGEPVSWALGLFGAALLAAPVAWWAVGRRRDREAGERL